MAEVWLNWVERIVLNTPLISPNLACNTPAETL
jgi:hypothetical protein